MLRVISYIHDIIFYQFLPGTVTPTMAITNTFALLFHLNDVLRHMFVADNTGANCG
ncbi:MAG: hypothetical protein ABH865_00600 [Candidatus Omnitrophota bacterium]